jgi:hypothetical protein
VVRLQEYSDEEAKDRAFCVAVASTSTIHDLLRRFSQCRLKASFYHGRVKHYQKVIQKKDQELESLTVQVGKMGQGNFSLQLRKRMLQQTLIDEKRDREKEKTALEAQIVELEKSNTFALSQAEAKVVVSEQQLSASQELLAKERADHAAEVKRLGDELVASVGARYDLSRRLDNAEANRHWLISQGFSFVFEKLRKSAEYLKPIAVVQQLVWDAGCHNGLLAGHAEAGLSLRPEESAYYKPDAYGQLSTATETFDQVINPYLEAIAG